MVKQYGVEIINNTPIDLDCEVHIDNKICIKSMRNKSAIYSHSCEKDEVELRITKIDKWKDQHIFNRVFMLLFSLDLVWGNLMESDNLPIFVEHVIKVNNYNEKSSTQILLSDIIKVYKSSADIWKKCVYIQGIEVLALIAFVAIISSFVFSGYYKAIPLLIALIIDISLFVAIKVRSSKVYAYLIKYAKE